MGKALWSLKHFSEKKEINKKEKEGRKGRRKQVIDYVYKKIHLVDRFIIITYFFFHVCFSNQSKEILHNFMVLHVCLHYGQIIVQFWGRQNQKFERLDPTMKELERQQMCQTVLQMTSKPDARKLIHIFILNLVQTPSKQQGMVF